MRPTGAFRIRKSGPPSRPTCAPSATARHRRYDLYTRPDRGRAGSVSVLAAAAEEPGAHEEVKQRHHRGDRRRDVRERGGREHLLRAVELRADDDAPSLDRDERAAARVELHGE